ncbi:uncharacterized protein LOC111721678 [Sarcophilus harrisii]|uniref:uncharacterized protein LOC111721678 n=1 Tax=Sarcophilus harrisii TaxID=9305 RepID=UPI0013019DDB|nr:uncharacterized protein LOC111721678 [Sarcophilus harrisii]
MGGGASSPWLEQPDMDMDMDMDRPDEEGPLRRNNIQALLIGNWVHFEGPGRLGPQADGEISPCPLELEEPLPWPSHTAFGVTWREAGATSQFPCEAGGRRVAGDPVRRKAGRVRPQNLPRPLTCVAMLRLFQLTPGQVPQRRADGRPGPQPPPGARPRMPQFQAESIRSNHPCGTSSRGSHAPVLHPRVVPAIPDLLATALAAGGEGIPGARPGALGYAHWPQAYLENQHAALFGAGDGRMRVSVPGRRSPFFPDPHRGRQAGPHMRRHRRSRALPELLLATLARTEGEFSGAGSQALAQAPQASQAAAESNSGDRAGPAPWPPRPQDPAEGLPQPAGRGEARALGAWSPPRNM